MISKLHFKKKTTQLFQHNPIVNMDGLEGVDKRFINEGRQKRASSHRRVFHDSLQEAEILPLTTQGKEGSNASLTASRR